MASELSVGAAFLLHLMGTTMFIGESWSRPARQSTPLPTFFVQLAIFLTLWKTALYPTTLRKVHWLPSFLIECSVSKFLLESSLAVFWYPLENALYNGLPSAIIRVTAALDPHGCFFNYTEDDVYRGLGGYGLSTLLCYVVSLGCLTTVLHATKTLDLAFVSGNGLEFTARPALTIRPRVVKHVAWWKRVPSQANAEKIQNNPPEQGPHPDPSPT